MKIYMAVNNEKFQFENLNEKEMNEISMDDIVKRLSYCVNKLTQLPAIEHRISQLTKYIQKTDIKIKQEKEKTVNKL